MRSFSKIEDLFSLLVDLLLLNLLFVLTSLPIITIGPSLCALYSVNLKMVSNEDPYLVRSYFRAFRLNFRQALPVSILLGLGLFFCITDLLIALRNCGILYLFLGTLACIGLLLLLIVSLYFFPILARFQFTTKQVFFNMIHMIAKHPQTLLSLILLLFPFLFFLFYSFYTAVAVAVFLLIIGFAALCHVCSIVFRKLFSEYELS